MWISTSDGGVNMWDGKGFYHYTESEGSGWIIDSTQSTLLEDQRGRIWAGSFKSGISILYPPQNGPFTRPLSIAGLSNDRPSSQLLEDRDGKVWIGAQGAGLLIWDPEEERQFSQYRTSEGLRADVIRGTIRRSKWREYGLGQEG
jgi:hypothetical protein